MVTKGKGRKSSGSQKQGGKARRHDGESIIIGDISGGTGFAIGRGAQANVTQLKGSETSEVIKAFGLLRQKLDTLPQGPDKVVAENAINALEAEAGKGEQATESTVQKWMKFLADTAPDIWDVAIDTFTNPVKGLGTVFMKIAKKAKAGQDAKRIESSAKE